MIPPFPLESGTWRKEAAGRAELEQLRDSGCLTGPWAPGRHILRAWSLGSTPDAPGMGEVTSLTGPVSCFVKWGQ